MTDMEKDDKKNSNGGEIDEQYLMSMMAGGVRKEGFEPTAAASEQERMKEPSVNKEKKQRKNSSEDYETLFLRITEGNARNGKSVYIRPDFHERLTRIVQVIGEDKVSLYSYLENVLEYHFREFGEGNIKYTYNNGIIAKDEKLAATNFLNALEKLPGYIQLEQKKIVEIQKDLPVLREVVNGTWSKENRLSELKSELAAVERKIQLSITPEPKEEPAEQTEKQKETPNISESIVRTKGIHLPRGVL